MAGPLDNARHERFAQAVADGETADAAYVTAGFEAHRGNAARLRANESVRARIAEIFELRGERIEITKERLVEELGKIGFSDIRRVVKWHSQINVARIDDDADTEALIAEGEIRFAVANQVELVSSGDVDDDTAAAISEVSMSDKGSIKIKLLDKRAALVDIAKIMGWHSEKVEHSGPGGGPIEVSDPDLARLIVFQLAKATKQAE